jgi:hypothetical protein
MHTYAQYLTSPARCTKIHLALIANAGSGAAAADSTEEEGAVEQGQADERGDA